MGTTLYRDYSQRELDAEYDNRRKVSEEYFLALSARLAKRSQDARQTWRCSLDVTYGTAPAERLDIFEPDSNLSTVIFFHGGYWRVNDKKDFAYVANGLLPHGIKLVVPGYGLIPTVTMDQLIEQCRRAVRQQLLGSTQARRAAGGEHQTGGEIAAHRLGPPRIACHTLEGVHGMSTCRTPNGRSASHTALTIVGGEPTVADSPMPLAPIG